MKKFYVESGGMRIVTEADNWKEAAKMAVNSIYDVLKEGKIKLKRVITVSTTGFDDTAMGGGWLDTVTFMNQYEAEKNNS